MTDGRWRRARNTAKFRAADSGVLAPLVVMTDPVTRRLGVRAVLRGDVDLTVDGFPGSGNTFTRWALSAAQPQPLRIAGKVHSPALMRRSAARGDPTVLVIREPADVVASTVARWPWMDLDTQLDRWKRFHESLLPVADRLVVAPFDIVTTDFGSIVRAINDRHGLELRIDDGVWATGAEGGPIVDEARSRRRREADAALADPRFAEAIGQASELYDRLV